MATFHILPKGISYCTASVPYHETGNWQSLQPAFEREDRI